MRRGIGLFTMAALCALALVSGSVSAKTTLTVAMHYGAGQKDYLLPYFEEYEELHPDIEIV